MIGLTPPIKKAGYTLLEIVAVVTIMGLLALAVVPFWTKSVARGREKAAKAELARYRQAVNSFYRDAGCYPASFSQLAGTSLSANCLNASGTSVAAPGDYRGPYLSDIKSSTTDGLLTINLSIASASGYSVGSVYVTSSVGTTDSDGRLFSNY
ncbi:MAG: type II secretion system protein [Armatimonadota bacterium]